MSGHFLVLLVEALVGTGLGLATAIYRPRSVSQWSFLLAMLLMSVEAVFQLLSLRAPSTDEMIQWQKGAWVPMALLPAVWLCFSLTYARGDALRFLQRWRLVLLLAVSVPLLLLFVGWDNLIRSVVWSRDISGNWFFETGGAGKGLFACMVIVQSLVLANLESTFRSAVGTVRWKIKYAIIGLALWCGAQIYTSSQVMLYSARGVELSTINAAAGILAGLFFSIAIFRSRLSKVEVYPSPTALHKSLAIILAGVYLLVVGLVAKAASWFGGGNAFPIASVVILLGVAGFGVICFSDRLRQAIRQIITRHFRRPSYDYRVVWSSFTQRTASCLDPHEYARRVVGLLAETFEALSVTMWVADPVRRCFTPAASSSQSVGEIAAASLDECVYSQLAALGAQSPGAVDLNRSSESWCSALKACHPAIFPKISGECLCLPLVHGQEVVGLVVLGDRVAGQPFSVEDRELLKCFGDQIAAGLRTLALSAKLIEARELEAFQMMSAFLVHDLKNTASALSLTLKNLPRHFENPAFREDALRALSRSVQRVNELIGRLSALRGKVELRRSRVDLNEIVSTACDSVGEPPHCPIKRDLSPLPRLLLDAAQMESVVVNLLLNAREATDGRGEVHIATRLENGNVVLTVQDNGCGMSAEFITHSLFKPFKTTKKNGLGIGMYQTKTIIEAHGGSIAVNSEPGRGTRFRITLPIEPDSSL